MGVFKRPTISILLYFIVILFNLSSWIDFDGVWAELPLLIPQLPEGWALPSQVTIFGQVAAIGPFIYFVANTIKPGFIKEAVAVYTVVAVGFTGCVLLMFFWDRTAYIAGAERSIALLVLTFFLAFTDNTSTIVFLSYFAILPADYLSAYYVGEAMCGLVPSVASLIQGAGEYDCVNVSSTRLANITSGYGNESVAVLANITAWYEKAVMREPNFSVAVFFGILATIMLTSGVAFTLINYHPWCKKFHVIDHAIAKPGITVNEVLVNECNSAVAINGKNANDAELDTNVDSNKPQPVEMTDVDFIQNGEEGEKPFMSTRLYVFLLLQYGYLQSARYGLLYNVQSYSLLPYGALAYSLGNRLTTVMQTLACIVALFFPTRSVKAITICTVLGTIPGVVIVVFSCLSPDPPFKDSVWGVIFVIPALIRTPALFVSRVPGAYSVLVRTPSRHYTVFCWLSMSTLWGYCKVGIAVLMKDQGKRHLMMTGAVEVICIFVASTVIFVLVNFTQIFKEAPQCPL